MLCSAIRTDSVFCFKPSSILSFYFLLFVFFPCLSFAQNRYDVVITEFMADPSPVVGLPESEYIEIKNRSKQDYQLRNWTISNGHVSTLIKADYLLKADSFLILCSNSAAAAFSLRGAVLGISGFPSLNNESGDIMLISSSGNIQHAVRYNRNWFGNELKASGGWSLEMIDPDYPASGKSNWVASISPAGGTPGKTNSVDAANPDSGSPSLLSIIAVDSLNLILLFSEAMDSLSASVLSNYRVTDGIGSPDSSLVLPPFFDRVALHLENPLKAGQVYTTEVNGLKDCSDNEISSRNSCKTGLPQKAENGDIVFNEVLFNPPTGGYDYIEIYNRSRHPVNVSELYIAGRDALGVLKDPAAIEKESRAFFPGEYLLLTENAEWVQDQYPLSEDGNMVEVSALPSMPDDAGKLVLLNSVGDLLDELDYDHHWHSPLISNESGVALERIRPEGITSQADNWTSASAPSGYGTPGYKNSENASDSPVSKFITVEPKLFSPDMDGYQDFCFVHYVLPLSGFIGSIWVYDITGRVVRQLANNLLLGTQGVFRWDGLDEQQNLLPMGHYIIYAEFFRPDGQLLNGKWVTTLARKR